MERTTVDAVRSYEIFDDGVRFDCETKRTLDPPRSPDRTVPVCLEFLAPDTFRFTMQANPEVAGPVCGRQEEIPNFFEPQIREEVEIETTETDDELHIETDALTVVVGLERWSFRVQADDEIVFEEQRSDIDVRGNNRADPLGFRETEINHGPYKVAESTTAIDLRPGESIYGFGEQFTGFDKRGQTVDTWHVEPLGTETDRAYKNIPFHLSTRGYGLLIDTTCKVRYDLGRDSAAGGTIAVEDDCLSFVFFYGPEFRDIIETYTGLTGRPKRPPKWSFGVWMSRLGYESREELETVAERLRKESIPADVLHLDPFWMREYSSTDLVWDREQFPDPEEMIEGLHNANFHLSLWEHPHVPVGTEAFETGREEGYFVKDGTGTPYVMERTCQGDYRGAIVDFTDPDAAEWWADKHRRLLEMGVDTFKTDYGEYIPADAVFHNGRTGTSGHNPYPYLYNKTVYEAIEEYRGEEDTLLWGRAAWTGSQRYPVHWGGDPQTTYSGMAAALRGGLTASLSGIGYWSHDIGGFRGEPSPELYVRWAQFGLLSSHARCHGTSPREPWAFGDRALDIFRRFARLRYRLLPYLYTQAEYTATTGVPLVRPLVFDYHDDPTTHTIDDQYLLGRDLLVAPVFNDSGERSIYLPAGIWYDWWDDKRYEGKQTIDRTVPLERLPLFIRAGSVIPQREPNDSVHAGPPDRLELFAVLAKGEAVGTYYDETRKETIGIEIDANDDRIEVSLAVTTSTCELQIDPGDTGENSIETVVVNGRMFNRTPTDPAPGEWTPSEVGITVVVDPDRS